ncbi:MAG: hypothetical protein CMG62_05520 [Candidatus Marinimicrobia bacterium]|nr:hypothetical protein [Candidatus Neomarinimicrobiota bacterium]|tara:strand:+ start:6817 stop:7092 length:276 start_codon:yes stop_codon:yes gene_type:complete
MDLITLVFIILFFMIITWYVIEPLFSWEQKLDYKADNKKNDLIQRKKILYQQLKDLELDREIENINQNEFILERQGLKKEVSDILEELKEQ